METFSIAVLLIAVGFIGIYILHMERKYSKDYGFISTTMLFTFAFGSLALIAKFASNV